ncbi:MAG: hypothetical protein H6735_33350 [Alphaproteobacteria bacterium]|nr:hypothetical protein [Alphaproteobacteria bacterium]
MDGLADVLGVVGAVDLDADGDPDLAWIDAVVDGTLAGGDGELRWMENRHKTFGAVGRADRAG